MGLGREHIIESGADASSGKSFCFPRVEGRGLWLPALDVLIGSWEGHLRFLSWSPE